MPSDIESDLAKSLSDLKEELRSGFSLLKSELVEENSLAIKKSRSTALSTPKLKKKGIEKQFEANSQDLDHVQSASSFLAATLPQVEKALKELEKRSRICTLGAHIISWLAWEILLRVWKVCCSLSKSVPRPELPAFSKSA